MSDAKTFQHTQDGQEVRQGDVNSMAGNGGQAVDRALWELFRLAPPSGGTPDRGIIPYGVKGRAAYTGLNSTATVQGNTADAKVRVMPFRAVIGSTATLAAPYEDNLRGQRSAYAIGSSFYTEVTIAPNASGDPRWDLIYATVTPDAVATSEGVLVKNSSPPFSVGTQTLDTFIKTTVVIGRQAGTPAAPPAYPTLPADGAGSYTIALAYVYVPDGFGAASTVLRQYIYEVAKALPMHEATGAIACRPASSLYVDGGAVDTNQSGNDRTAPDYYAPSAYLPGTMQGAQELLIQIQLEITDPSHVDGDVVDNKIDWRFRHFRWEFQSKSGNTSADGFAASRSSTGTQLIPSAVGAGIAGSDQDWGFGQSFVEDDGEFSGIPAGSGVAMYLSSNTYTSLGGANKGVGLYVDMSTGELKIALNNTPGAQIFVWLKASGQYSNFGTV